MSLDHTARLGLPYLAAGQMQKHVTLNEALTRLDALVQCAVASRSQAEPPADPPNGLMHILPAGAASGDWNDAAPGALVRADGAQWFTVERAPGLVAWVADESVLTIWTGETWIDLGGEGLGESLPLLGVNTTADETNRFAARLNTALWTALTEADGGTGDLRYVMNKEGAADVLSLLLQSGFEGRAELGLVGDDDFSLKVSEDGETWREALRVSRATGRAAFAAGCGRSETTTLSAGGDYAIPAWARRVRVVLTGGGGGGGAGAAAASGSRFGGGGGGAAGRSDGEWPADSLGTTLSVAIGAGGTVGAAGGTSTISANGGIILTAGGGLGGGTGGSTAGTGGGGGFGATRSNGGGSSGLSSSGSGLITGRYDAPGAGGAGASLDGSGATGSAGSGGIGAYILGGARTAGGSGGAAGAAGGAGAEAAAGEISLAGGGGGGAQPSGAGGAGGAGGSPGGGGGGGGSGSTAGGEGGPGGGGRAVIIALG
ncbi:DUF2793 domain-containing protein [Brevundimonas sp.]|uniref:DUF2793 domain-containing protein n=1 Tax=Brevundimonas sp. TaxID=1871086 RepID=UPI0035B1E057